MNAAGHLTEDKNKDGGPATYNHEDGDNVGIMIMTRIPILTGITIRIKL